MSDVVCEYEVSGEGVSEDGVGVFGEVWVGGEEVGEGGGGGGAVGGGR